MEKAVTDPKCPYLLIVEDDPDDRMIFEEACRCNQICDQLYFLEDGEELTDFLFRRGRYTDSLTCLPNCIILDLNMPRKDGRMALTEIRREERFRDLDIIVYTTSSEIEDKEFCSLMGVAEFITKPGDFLKIVEVIKRIEQRCE